MSDEASSELLRQQAREFICGKLDHDWRSKLPIQTRDETRQVLCVCAMCEEESWEKFPEEAYRRILADVASGEIHP